MTPIWIYWEQGWDTAPPLVLECATSWETLNPDYNLIRLSKASICNHAEIDEEVMELLDGMRVQTQTDLIRLILLAQKGGIWVDATLFCSTPLSQWLQLTSDRPVALFENPGPDRLVSSWFIASLPNSKLIELWLAELIDFLQSLPNHRSPTGVRKLVLKAFQAIWAKSPRSTLNWWGRVPKRYLSLTPYYLIHYCYNRLAITNKEFAELAKRKIGLPAEDAHDLQFKLMGKKPTSHSGNFQDSPVHKLNWRKFQSNKTINQLLKDLSGKKYDRFIYYNRNFFLQPRALPSEPFGKHLYKPSKRKSENLR